jgi:hypothetical protein
MRRAGLRVLVIDDTGIPVAVLPLSTTADANLVAGINPDHRRRDTVSGWRTHHRPVVRPGWVARGAADIGPRFVPTPGPLQPWEPRTMARPWTCRDPAQISRTVRDRRPVTTGTRGLQSESCVRRSDPGTKAIHAVAPP